jgi:hypothetical protein
MGVLCSVRGCQNRPKYLAVALSFALTAEHLTRLSARPILALSAASTAIALQIRAHLGDVSSGT